MLQNLNTYRCGFIGLAAGAVSVCSAVAALFKLLSQPEYLISLYWSFSHLRHHQFMPADATPIAQLVGALVWIFGTVVLAVLAAYFGMPRTVRTTPPPPTPGTVVALKQKDAA